jgi:hypothetical protein
MRDYSSHKRHINGVFAADIISPVLLRDLTRMGAKTARRVAYTGIWKSRRWLLSEFALSAGFFGLNDSLIARS